MRYMMLLMMLLTTPAWASERIAAVYRGPAGCDDCTEAVVNALQRVAPDFRIRLVGPEEDYPLNEASLKDVSLYVQPGGGQDIPGAVDSIGQTGIEAVTGFVARGGAYLGLCMGAYLASDLGYGLIKGDTDSEVGRPGFGVRDIRDTVVRVAWQGVPTWLYFQDGPYLPRADDDKAFKVLGTYANGDIAAAVYGYGAGRVVLVGPHPEADRSWFDYHRLNSRVPVDFHVFKSVIKAATS